MRSATRSFTLPPGLANSHLTKISHPVREDREATRSIGVRPMLASTSGRTRGRAAGVERGKTAGHGGKRAKRRRANAPREAAAAEETRARDEAAEDGAAEDGAAEDSAASATGRTVARARAAATAPAAAEPERWRGGGGRA
jgi:hypothetical protein